jgi:lipopolysaccharide export system permease protein
VNCYNRYVLKQLFVGLVLVGAGLTCIIWLSQSLRFVEMIVNRGLGASTFVYMTMLLLPNFLTVILPIALFAVVVFVYSKMVTDRELVVMRAAGVGQFGLAKPALVMILMTMGLGYVLNFYILPESYKSFRLIQWEARNSLAALVLKEGAFNQVTRGMTVYIRERTSDGQLLGILVHDKRNPESPETIMSERGALVESETGARVVMFNGNRQTLDDNDKLSILYFDRNVFEIPNTRESLSNRYREPRERSMMELIYLEDAQGISEQDYGKYKVELHKRIVSPLLGFGFAMAGLACLLYGPITRRSQTLRIVTAVVIMISLQGAALGLENIIAKNLALVPTLYALALLPILIGTFMLTCHPKTSKNAARKHRERVKAAEA